MPQPQSLKPHWFSWLFASTFMPALPFLIFGGKALNKPEGLSPVILALIVQLAASIYLARGISARRQLGIGGIIGLSVVFMMASVAIGIGVFFVACLSTLNSQSFH